MNKSNKLVDTYLKYKKEIDILADENSLFVLSFISNYEPISIPELLDDLSITKKDLQVYLNRYKNASYIEIRNKNIIFMTDIGKDFLSSLDLYHKQVRQTTSSDYYPSYNGDIILLLGSGASNYLNLPSLGHSPIEDISYIERRKEKETRIIKEVRDLIFAYKRGNVFFEEIILTLRNYLKTSMMIRTDYVFREEFGQIPEKVLTGKLENTWKKALIECYRILLNEYSPQNIDIKTKEFNTTLTLFRELSSLNGGQLNIYTTNYDCSFQVFAATSTNLSFLTHINNENGKFTNNWYPSNYDTIGPNIDSIYVNRLHGCVAWFNDYTNPFTIEEVYGAGSYLEIADEEKLLQMAIKIGAQSLEESYYKESNPAFELANEEFASHLNTAKALLVWGYSFRDPEMIKIMNISVSKRKYPLQIFVLDPFITENIIIRNIRSTLSDIPSTLYQNLKIRKIDWLPSDGNNAMLKRTINFLKAA